jgi:hypothetical protein
MDLMTLKKKIDGFKNRNGQLRDVAPDLLFEIRQTWENYTGPVEQFRRELGIRVGTLRKLLIESKKLNHVLASSEAVGLTSSESVASNAEEMKGSQKPLELVYDGGSKILRFPTLDLLMEFLRKAS